MPTQSISQPISAAPPAETALQREARIQRELAIITQAHADIDAGLGMNDEDVEAWLDRLDSTDNAPVSAASPERS